MIKKSLISLILLAIIIPLIIIGGKPFALLIGVVSILAIKEITDIYKIPIVVKFLAFLGLITIVYSNFDASKLRFGLDYQVLSLNLIILLTPIIFYQIKGKYSVKDAFELFGFILLIGIGLSYIILIRDFNLNYFLLMIFVPVITDSFAYISGVLIGKHKVTKLSPNKSLEGYIIGTLIGTFIMSVYYIIFINNQSNKLIVIGLILSLSIIGQIGDLFFSAIKRKYDLKDFSNLIPKHGGVLDRLDSLIFVAIFFMLIIGYL